MMLIDPKFEIKQIVFLKTDPEQRERIVTGILIRETSITYALGCGSSDSWHYDFEITTEKDVLKATAN